MLSHLLLKELKLSVSPWSLIPETQVIKSYIYIYTFLNHKFIHQSISSCHYFPCLLWKDIPYLTWALWVVTEIVTAWKHMLPFVCCRDRTRTRLPKCSIYFIPFWTMGDVNLNLISVWYFRCHKGLQRTHSMNILFLIQSQTQKGKDK